MLNLNLPNAFIAFEGGDGSGKTTQSKNFVERLVREGHPTLWTREPGDGPLGSKIREILLSPETGVISHKAEALLFAADRAQHVEATIRPALKNGPVVTDRYIDSSGAYQANGRGLEWSEVLNLSLWATDDLLPDLIFVIDVNPSSAAVRMDSRSTPDRMEQESLAFKASVRKFMLDQAAAHPTRYVVIDGLGTIEEVAERVWDAYIKWDLQQAS